MIILLEFKNNYVVQNRLLFSRVAVVTRSGILFILLTTIVTKSYKAPYTWDQPVNTYVQKTYAIIKYMIL